VSTHAASLPLRGRRWVSTSLLLIGYSPRFVPGMRREVRGQSC
jgi:hypothetical protein